MLLSVTCVCAGDDNSINGIDEDGIYLENGGNAFLQEDNTITSSNEWYVDGNKIEDGNGSADNPFNNLKSSIDQSKEGDTIHIAPGTYKGSGLNVNLSIDKGLNLVNSGAGDVILDGESKYRIFNVSAQSLNVTGLTFTHGYCEDYGGAIYFANGLSDSRIDADFIENNARLGGAIYFDGIMNNNVFTGSYIRNEVLSNGGAMLVTGIATNNLFSADFRENKGKGYYGGAIHFTNQTSHNTFLGNFTGNVIVEGSGAGIVFDWDVNDTVFLANFSNNRVHEFPSAAFEVYGTSCNNTFGGYFENNVESAVLLSKCIDCTFNATFVNNSARHGGILSLEQSINNYINCTFINNRGQRGTALNIIMNVINTTIDGLFVNNTSTRLGGAIAIYPYIETMNYTIENVTIKGIFINNTAASYGGAVYLVSRSGVLFNGSVFESNSAQNGGAIYLNAPDVVADSCVFVNNNAGNNGGAIYSHEALDLIGCRFENNTAANLGGAVFIENDLSDSQIKSTFISNHAFDGGAMFVSGKSHNNMIESYFENNSADRAGGAAYLLGDAVNNTFKSEFYANNASQAGGGGILFYGYAEGNVFESVFTHNYAYYGAGLFFFNESNGNIFNSDFRYNVAESCGGALFFHNTTDNNRFEGSFISNTALGKVTPENGNGGAITFKGTSANSIFDCDFIGNSARLYGGAVNYHETPYNITFNSNFINNSARYGGGVNFFESLENIVFNGDFINNSAVYGGGVCIRTGEIENTSFKGNRAVYGGAIFFNGTGHANNIEFANNSAAEGGAIFTNGNLTVENAAFRDNRADDGTNQISLNATVGTVTLSNVTPEEVGPYKIADLRIVDIAIEDMLRITANVTWKGNPVNEGNASVIIDNRKYTAKVENGIAVIKVHDLAAGIYLTDVTFEGGQYYSNPSQSVGFNITKKDTKLITPSRVISVMEGVNGYEYQFILKDVDGNALAGRTVSVSFNGKNQTVITDDAGWGTATLYANAEGSYDVLIGFAGDIGYGPIAQNGTVKLVKEKTGFVAPDRAVYVQQMSRGYTYSAILKDVNGKALANKKVLFIFNGKKQVTYTDENGWATVKLTADTAGEQRVTIRFAGDRYYRETETTRTINIVREASVLTVDDYVFNAADKPKQVTAKLVSKSNAAVNDAKITLKVNGITYTARTNESGIAVFSIDLSEVGFFDALANFETSRFFRPSAATSKIVIN